MLMHIVGASRDCLMLVFNSDWADLQGGDSAMVLRQACALTQQRAVVIAHGFLAIVRKYS